MKTYILIFLISISNVYSFEATNFTGTKQEFREFFDGLWSKFKTLDNYHCYRRAHILANQMKSNDIKSMKVFFFKGDKLLMPMGWYYHVAPMVYYKNTPVVVDKGLFKGATYLDDWLEAFSEGHSCKEISTMDEYRKYKSSEYCMYFIVPMYYYSPKSLEETNIMEFNNSDLNDMIYSIPKRQRKKYLKKYTLDQ
jgi:hypothetical protein